MVPENLSLTDVPLFNSSSSLPVSGSDTDSRGNFNTRDPDCTLTLYY